MSESGFDNIAVRQSEKDAGGDLEKVRAIFRSLAKYINGKKIYSSNNPNLARFAESFRYACEAYFSEENELALTVEQYSLSWREQIVYRNERRDESIAFLLYKDGVGEISIHRPVDFEELERFVDIIKDETHNYSSGVDIVNKLWRADFECIRYRVFDEYFVGESIDMDSENDMAGELVEADDHEDMPSFSDKGRIVAGSYVPKEAIGEYANHLAEQQCGDAGEEQREQFIQKMMISNFAVSNDELEYFEEALANERTSDMLVQFFAVILDFARIPGHSASAGDIQSIITHLIEYFMDEFDVRVLTQVLGVVKKFIREHAIHEECRLFFKHIDEQFTTPSMLLSLGRIAQRSKGDAKNVFQYYRLVGKKTVPTICALLADSHFPWLHAEGCRAIIDLGRDDIHQIIRQLDMDKPRIAHDIVHILRKLEEKEVHPIVKELIYYPDVTVKEELIALLVSIENEEALQLLVKLLDDEQPQIRMKTMKAVEQIKNPIITGKIMELAFEEDIELKNMDEQERIFSVVGKTMGETVLPRIAGMVRERSMHIFGKKTTNKRKKILAIRALEHINGSESSCLLAKLAGDSDAMVRAKAAHALTARGERLGSEAGGDGPEEGYQNG